MAGRGDGEVHEDRQLGQLRPHHQRRLPRHGAADAEATADAAEAIAMLGASASLVTLTRPCFCRFFFLKSVARLRPFLACFAFLPQDIARRENSIWSSEMNLPVNER